MKIKYQRTRVLSLGFDPAVVQHLEHHEGEQTVADEDTVTGRNVLDVDSED